MPTNRTTLVASSARLQRLAIEALRAADKLIAQPIDAFDAAHHLAAPASTLAAILDLLEDTIYRTGKLDQRHHAENPRVNRILARHAA